jgi:TatD DNase family protein
MEQAQAIIRRGFLLGIGGVVTFKKSGLDAIVAEIPIENIVLETDGPYLAPTPHRGKRNVPAYLRLIAEKVAEIKNISVEEVAQITTQNSRNVFGR